mgnify:CR=1 FL=1
MPTRKRIVIDDIRFETSEPTVVPISRLFTWVIWQFPRVREGGFSWYPAIINSEAGQVTIYGQVKEPYPTPEAAAKYLDRAKS